MTTADRTPENHLPACRLSRGYDTHVHIRPRGACRSVNPLEETHRIVEVICSRHHITARRSFTTCGLSGEAIAAKQSDAFDDAFVEVHDQCCAIVQAESEASL